MTFASIYIIIYYKQVLLFYTKRMTLKVYYFFEERKVHYKRNIFSSIELTISSGPSQLCLYSKPSGTILLSIISISSLTSGSQLSFNAKLAEV